MSSFSHARVRQGIVILRLLGVVPFSIFQNYSINFTVNYLIIRYPCISLMPIISTNDIDFNGKQKVVTGLVTTIWPLKPKKGNKRQMKSA